FEEVQHLEKRRALAPEAAGGDLEASERGAERGGDLDAELGKVAGREGPALGAMKLGDAFRGLTAIELVPSRPDSGLAATARLRFRASHPTKRLAQLTLHEHLTDSERPVIPQVERSRLRPAAILVGVRPHLVRRELRDG